MFKSKKIITILVCIALLVVPNMAFAQNEKGQGTILSEKVISDKVKQIVKDHGPLTEPLIVDSGLIDAKDGMKVSFYIVPENYSVAEQSMEKGDFSIMATTPLSGHWIKQGSKMVYSKSNGDPWTVAIGTNLSFTFYNSETSATLMKRGYQNTAGTDEYYNQSSGTWDGTYRNYSYSNTASITTIRFFITNLSAADVYINGGAITF